MLYLALAYLLLWAITFGYLLLLGSRQRQLQRELDLFVERKLTESPPSDDQG